jgi:transcriptional regulator with PAS, ATPase and Fis domain
MDPITPETNLRSPLDTTRPAAFELLSKNPDLTNLVKILRRAAPTVAPILISGESGTGKELVARAIHELSPRHAGPLVCLNLAAVPTDLAETVLFGHEKGAFTGAFRSARGFCRAADTGTLFLDEITESSLSLQAKLLRFLQSSEVQPVGSDEVVKVDVRIVTATNRELISAISENRFREDLFHRLNIVQIHLPPLRDRPRDVGCLMDFFIDEMNARYGRSCSFTAEAREALATFDWPGNVRQLQGYIERLVVLAESDRIGVSDLPAEIRQGPQVEQAREDSVAATGGASREIDRMTYRIVRDILDQQGGNVSSTAQRLGIARATLYRWLKRSRKAGDKI